ncbi:hypothetical protein QJS04_geneDACA004469 [Acorus gramineus]|uniref:Uncharacterized protein n=1 Tax=Acorus gramineus TaxID=55184 RepID=A0AAV9B740_ACOGR|nr:hypothetical protein QJS04_geneDACA004469 [Acorus gramineus]
MRYSLNASLLFLASLLLLLVVTSEAHEIYTRRECNGTVGECDDHDEWFMESDTVWRLLQQGRPESYNSLQRSAACASSRGGAYENRCFSKVNPPRRGCSPYYGCRGG